MSDVRALLKAKRDEVQIIHPFAAYSPSGQLRCTACATLVKHASAWQGHLGSKIHRTNVARLREEERLRKQESRLREETDVEQQHSLSKRKLHEKKDKSDDEGDVFHSKRVKRENGLSDDGKSHNTGPHTLPAGFFSDPIRQPSPPPDSEDSEGEGDTHDAKLPAQGSNAGLNDEWELFQNAMLDAPDDRDAYERATVFAEPELASQIPEGFPAQLSDVQESEERELTKEEIRRKKEEEERELIIDRLLDEEQAQEEADMKVALLKTRLEVLKKNRAAARMAKSK